jgi:hypothetical protein
MGTMPSKYADSYNQPSTEEREGGHTYTLVNGCLYLYYFLALSFSIPSALFFPFIIKPHNLWYLLQERTYQSLVLHHQSRSLLHHQVIASVAIEFITTLKAGHRLIIIVLTLVLLGIAIEFVITGAAIDDIILLSPC